jgi:hypothetical protein
MTLIACERPVTPSTVKPNEKAWMASIESRPGTPASVMRASSSTKAAMAESAVRTRRTNGTPRFIRSSISPQRNPGAAQARRSHAAAGVPAWVAKPATMPAATATPPMRGTGAAWIFCTPAPSSSTQRARVSASTAAQISAVHAAASEVVRSATGMVARRSYRMRPPHRGGANPYSPRWGIAYLYCVLHK